MLVIKRVQQRGELLQVIGHPVRLISNGARLQDRRIGRQFPDQPQFVRIRQHREIRLARQRDRRSLASSDPPEAGDPGMRILHIVHGIVGRPLFGQFEIKFQCVLESRIRK